MICDQVKTGDEVEGKWAAVTRSFSIKNWRKETKDKKEKWTSVNPGFTFNLSRNQTTQSLLTDGDLGQKITSDKRLQQKKLRLPDNDACAIFW